MVNPYFIPNSTLNLVAALVALAVSYYAFRYGRLASSSFLRFIALGFMMLGIGLLAQGSVFILFAYNVGRLVDRVALVYDATIIYLALQAFAYLLITLGYTRRVQGGPTRIETGTPALVAGVATPLLFGTYVLEFGQLVILILVGLIVFQGALVYGEQRNRFSLTVLGAFAMILLAHLGELGASLLSSGLLFLLGDVAQLAGFSLLLLFVLRSGPVGST